MELENSNIKQTYIQLLTDSLKRKKEVLIRLSDITKTQEEMISDEGFDEEQFIQTLQLKEEQLNVLDKLDSGYEKIYSNVKEELSQNRNHYRTEIEQMKELIIELTNLSVELQAMEKRNKSKLESLLTMKRKDIKNSRISNQSAASYYKTMTKQQEEQSYFYDKKN